MPFGRRPGPGRVQILVLRPRKPYLAKMQGMVIQDCSCLFVHVEERFHYILRGINLGGG